MTPSLVDVNIWLALLVKEHVHHAATLLWFESLGPSQAGLCRIVQLTLIRLLGNPTIMAAGALPAAVAWSRIAELMEDERVEFLAEPSRLDSVLPNLFRYPVPTPRLVADAYLAAFAICAGRVVVTRC